MARDPLIVARERLAADGAAEADVRAADEAAAKIVAEAVAAAKAAPEADLAEALVDVWADGGAAWRT